MGLDNLPSQREAILFSDLTPGTSYRIFVKTIDTQRLESSETIITVVTVTTTRVTNAPWAVSHSTRVWRFTTKPSAPYGNRFAVTSEFVIPSSGSIRIEVRVLVTSVASATASFIFRETRMIPRVCTHPNCLPNCLSSGPPSQLRRQLLGSPSR